MPEAVTEILLDARRLGRGFGAHRRAHKTPPASDATATTQAGGIHDVSLRLERGDVLGLLGLNGAGKSTTLRLLAGVLRPETGSVSIAGHSLEDDPLEARANIGYLPDTPPLYPDMRVETYLLLAARLRRLRGREAKDAVERIIGRCSLAEVGRVRIATLSKGFRQRVGLAQALVHDPEVLLLDEPGNGLDPQQTEELRHLVREAGRLHCVVFSTHLLHEAKSVCNRIAVLHEGSLLTERPAAGSELDELFARLARGEPDVEGTAPRPGAAPEPGATGSDPGRAPGSVQESAPGSAPGSARENAQESAMRSAQGSAQGSTRGSTRGSTQGSTQRSASGSGTRNATRDGEGAPGSDGTPGA